MLTHCCCFSIALILVPGVYGICQFILLAVVDGWWRYWSMTPLVVFLAVLVALLVLDRAALLPAVVIAAAAGLVAVGLVWFVWANGQHPAKAPESS